VGDGRIYLRQLPYVHHAGVRVPERGVVQRVQ